MTPIQTGTNDIQWCFVQERTCWSAALVAIIIRFGGQKSLEQHVTRINEMLGSCASEFDHYTANAYLILHPMYFS